jgi:multidrug efflux pump subunit AcrA (membrane-fusion protein)
MKSSIHRWIPLAAMIVASASCDSGKKTDEAAAMEEGEAATNRIDIPATVRSNIGITFAKVERRQVADTLRVPGSFELKPLAKHEYRLLLPGHVRFEIDQFAEVKPGTLLYRFQSPKWLELQSRIDQAVAGYEQAKLKHDALDARLAALAKADFKRADLETEASVLHAELSGRKAELDAALTTATNIINAHGPKENALSTEDLLALVQINGNQVPRYRSIGWIDAKAIEPGIVESLAITDGSFVEETTLVITTIDPTQVRFRALGLQSDLAKLRQTPAARIVPHQSGGGNLNDSVPANLTIGLDADPNQRTIPLYANPQESRPWSRPGVSAFLEVVTASTGGPVLAIPRSAVVKDGITHVFFKRDPLNPNKAIRVEADLGLDDGRWVEVKSDLGPNDEVVLQGAYELKLASAQSGTSQKGGHFHADGTYHGKH